MDSHDDKYSDTLPQTMAHEFAPLIRQAPVLKAAQFVVHDITALAQNTNFLINAQVEPDEWLVSVASANGQILVYQEPIDTGAPMRLVNGSVIKIPAKGQFLTVRNTGSNAADITVLALSGLNATWTN